MCVRDRERDRGGRERHRVCKRERERGEGVCVCVVFVRERESREGVCVCCVCAREKHERGGESVSLTKERPPVWGFLRSLMSEVSLQGFWVSGFGFTQPLHFRGGGGSASSFNRSTTQKSGS